MTDQQWKRLQDELKSIAPNEIDGPADPARFKERVLQEYERRNRQEQRGQWFKRTATVVTAGAAVWAAMVLTGPMERSQEDSTASSPSSAKQSPQPTGAQQKAVAPVQLVNQFFDLTINGQESETKNLLTPALQGKQWLAPPAGSKAHPTGFAYKEISAGGETMRYRVDLGWGTFGNRSVVQNYEVTLGKEELRWVITEIRLQGEQSVAEQSGKIVIDQGGNEQTTAAERKSISEQGELTMFAANPADISRSAFAVKADQPLLYRLDSTADQHLTRLATLPAGDVGEIFWVGDEVLVVNFTPQGKDSQHQILFFDALSGKSLNQSWLGKHLKQLGLEEVHVIHSLPGNRVRISAGAVTMIADLTHHTLSTDQAREPQMQTVKYDGQQMQLPDSELKLYYPDQNPAWPQQLNIPQDKRLDLTQEAGVYIANGSVESFSIVGNELQIGLRREAGRAQILAVPYSMISLSSGQEVRIKAFDENGEVVGVPRTIQMR